MRPWHDKVLITLNPYQGLKRRGMTEGYTEQLVLITLNPYQGLKHNQAPQENAIAIVLITLNPYQGLKRKKPKLRGGSLRF